MNTILTDKYRELYKPVIAELFQYCPEMMSRKISEANVQQAFTYLETKQLSDSPTSPLHKVSDSRILCVGSFEDTAYEALKKQGYNIIGIDPAVNYDLDYFYRSHLKTIVMNNGNTGCFNIIFSTSVIEHVPDDEQFIDQICKLLVPGGYGILTCDFRDDWKPGQPLPGEDQRLYTKNDLLVRLNAVLNENNCALVNMPDYDYPPDFTYGVYNYSFATYMFIKSKVVNG